MRPLIKPHFILNFITVLIISLNVNAQTFQVDTILYNGDPNKFINIVFIGDGYQNNEMPDFITNVQNATNYFFSTTPFSEYKNYFNVFAIKVPSTQSGTDHPRTAPDCPPQSSHPTLSVNTFYNSSFDYFSIHRLLVPSSYAINNVILNNFPLYDQKIMIVNTPYYGGSGGSTATASCHTSSNEIVLHEIGHSFAALKDEYWPGYGDEGANMTQETNPALVRWKNWIGFGGVGIYKHGNTGTSATWYRPHNNCKMRFLGPDFCPVCKEAITLSILQKFGTPIETFLPNQSVLPLTTDSMQFEISLYKPYINTLRTKWLLNGVCIASNTDSLTIMRSQLNEGSNFLSVSVLDTTSLIRADTHLVSNTYSINWTITINAGIVVTDNILGLKIYPNPVSNELIIEIEGNNELLNYEIINTIGQVVYKGNFIKKTTVQTSNFAPGVYLVKFENGKIFEFKKIIKD